MSLTSSSFLILFKGIVLFCTVVLLLFELEGICLVICIIKSQVKKKKKKKESEFVLVNLLQVQMVTF